MTLAVKKKKIQTNKKVKTELNQKEEWMLAFEVHGFHRYIIKLYVQ